MVVINTVSGEILKDEDMDNDHLLRVGESMTLPKGYAITALEIDVEGDKVWLELTRDGVLIDDCVCKSGALCYLKGDYASLSLYVEVTFAGMNTNLVKFNNLYLADTSIEIYTVPEGASIYVDNEFKGLTPITLYDISKGDHEIVFKLNFHQDLSANVIITAGETIKITETLQPVPCLSVSPDPFSFEFTIIQGESESREFSISKDGTETLIWNITCDQPWITVYPETGINSANVIISINTLNLNLGSHIGNINLNSNGGIKEGIIYLNVVKAPEGAIIVNTNIESATFTISGPTPCIGSGKQWIKESAPAGTYTIIYNPVSGYETPPPENKKLTTDGAIIFSGNYLAPTPETGTIIVESNIESAAFTISGPTPYSGSGQHWEKEYAPTGTYTIKYEPVKGYETHPTKNETLFDGGMIRFIGNYTLVEAGTIIVNTNIESATFTISGPTNYSGSGGQWIEELAPQGNYRIIYGPVIGYKEPSSQNKTLCVGDKIIFSGNYSEVIPIELIVTLIGAIAALITAIIGAYKLLGKKDKNT